MKLKTYKEDTKTSEERYGIKKGVADEAGLGPRRCSGGGLHDACEDVTVVERAAPA